MEREEGGGSEGGDGGREREGWEGECAFLCFQSLLASQYDAKKAASEEKEAKEKELKKIETAWKTAKGVRILNYYILSYVAPF